MSLALQTNDIDNVGETIVIGLGETGFSVARYLRKQNIVFSMLDTRTHPPLLAAFKQDFPEVDVRLNALSEGELANAAQIIVSPGIDIHEDIIKGAIVNNGCECIGDVELFSRSTDIPIVAITGSNGKSTVTSLFNEMARASSMSSYAGGNLSPPALDLLNHKDAELFVLELSSFQLESIKSLQPEASVVLNVSPDHLDRHGDVGNYAAVKEHIYSQAKFSIVNRDDEYVSQMKYSGEVISFGLGHPKEGEFGVIKENGNLYVAFGDQCLLPIEDLALQGESGTLNSLAALALGHALQLPMLNMLDKLKSFKGLPHRLALITDKNGVSWFDDSKGTNIGATISSLRSLEKNIILIVGGVFKGGDLAQLREAVITHAKHVILMGQDASVLKRGLEGDLSIDMPFEIVSSMNEAVEVAQKAAVTGDQVLLSPACASFDMYANYIERGCDFERCVKGLSL
ncbi:MAG: UDP-N-acetylmuramoyl-L-alanine--D-glutamate ligase [Gammaproteobacteria bacterium]